MKLSVSNIAWSAEDDEEMYGFLSDNGFYGLELAPTRLYPENPYNHLTEAKEFSTWILNRYGLCISSLQSIWYGRKEHIFSSAEDRAALVAYTKQAVDFAVAVGCPILVFGCPHNRSIPDGLDQPEIIAADFFNEIADYAYSCGIIIALEPNPPIYGTNFINETRAAFDFSRRLNNSGLRVNVDVGTMIHFNEPVALILDNIELVNHIHLSEPKLVPLEERTLYKEVLELPFEKFFSIEMCNCGDIMTLKRTIEYISGLAKRVKG